PPRVVDAVMKAAPRPVENPQHGAQGTGGDWRVPKPLYQKMQLLLPPALSLHCKRRIRGILRFLSHMHQGRNTALNNSAFAFRELIADGSLSGASAAELLFLASELNGYVSKDGAKA